MADRKKKLAAALGAVSLYLQQEEAAAQEQQMALAEPGKTEFSHWAHSGRQESMALRRLIQLRTFTRF